MNSLIRMRILVCFWCIATTTSLQINGKFFIRHGIPPARTPYTRSSNPIWKNITQRLDNFDPTNPKKWQMRYIENGQFFKQGGPIFLMLGGEWTIDKKWLQDSRMVEIAEVHYAQMYYTEHRYYGKSYPTEDFSTDNLRYLSVDQALADIANFIQQTRENNLDLADSKVIVFGGSYGGTLATWMRQKYPQLVHAAVASSGPLYAKIDFWEYQDVVKVALGSKCAAVLQNASEQIHKYLKEGKNKKVEDDFKTCSPIKDENDIHTLFMYIASNISGTVQYGNESTIDSICSNLQNSSFSSDYESLVSYLDFDSCTGSFEEIINSTKNTSVNSGNGRQWFYQTCTNFGWFQTAWGNNSLYGYGIPPDFYSKLCQEVFGLNISSIMPENVDATNTKHGGLEVGASRIISIQGALDPWHRIGENRDINPKSPSYLVQGVSHCWDMYSSRGYESSQMHQANKAVIDYIAKWLEEPY